jgi:Fungal chitosanase of glycosyl hydrolase group 75
MKFLQSGESIMAYTPPSASLGRLGTIVDKIAEATPINKDITKKPKIFATLPDGQIFFDIDELELDTDGWPDGPDGDPSWQRNTSLRYADKGSVNSNAVPYYVLPGPKDWYASRGVSLGDYAAVLFKDKLAFAVFGDIGPKKKLGEGSLELMRRLGVERMKPNNTVINAGMGPRVLTLVFPGSGNAAHRTNQAKLLASIDTTAKPLFTALGGSA